MKPPKNNLFVTIEIQKVGDIKRKWSLLRFLFIKFLIDDEQFHYFFEPNLIIRLSNLKVLKNVTAYLDKQKIKHFEYDYPYNKNPDLYYGEPKKRRNPHYLLMELYHLHAIASLVFKKKDIEWYTNRNIHCLFNMRGLEYHEEVIESLKYAYNYALIDKKYDHDK